MVIIIVAAIAEFAFFLLLHSRHRNPIFSAIVGMSLGLTALILAAELFSVTVNLFSVFVALTLGVPGAALVTVGRLVLL